jgi:hypothetical protein
LCGEIVHDKLIKVIHKHCKTQEKNPGFHKNLRMTIEMQDGTARKENNTGANLNFLFKGGP